MGATPLQIQMTSPSRGQSLAVGGNRRAFNSWRDVWVHEFAGVTGDGSSGNPWAGWESSLEALPANSQARFIPTHNYLSTRETTCPTNISLLGRGAIWKSVIPIPATKSVSSITLDLTRVRFVSGGIATVTCNGHGFNNGDMVVIAGANQSAYNGQFTVYNKTTNTFKVIIYGRASDAPASPATGTITVRKGNYSLRYFAPFQSYPPGILWGPDSIKRFDVSGIIFDGNGTCDGALYLRNVYAAAVNGCQFGNYTQIYINTALFVASSIRDCLALINETSPIRPQYGIRLGEPDPNPDGQYAGGAANSTYKSSWFGGFTKTALEIVQGFGVNLSGQIDNADVSVRIHREAGDCTLDCLDYESGITASLWIDGYRHRVMNCNAPVGDKLRVDGEGGFDDPATFVGGHIFESCTGGVEYNADAYSEFRNHLLPWLIGTHPERARFIQDAQSVTDVYGTGNNNIKSLVTKDGTGAAAVCYELLCEGFRQASVIETSNGFFIFEGNAVHLTDFSLSYLTSHAALKIGDRTVTCLYNLAVSNDATVTGNVTSAGLQTTAINIGTGILGSNPIHLEISESIANSATGAFVYLKNTLTSGGGHASIALDKGSELTVASLNFLTAGALQFDAGCYNNTYYIRDFTGGNMSVVVEAGAPANSLRVKTTTGDVTTVGKIRATGGLGVGNSASATTLGSVTKKIEVFDASGASLGFLPVYSSIT